MAKANPKQYAASLALYEKLVATNPKVERKGATMPYTSLNGHMFSLLTRRAGWRSDSRVMCGKRFSRSTRPNSACNMER